MHRKLTNLLSKSNQKQPMMSPKSNSSTDITQFNVLHKQIINIIECKNKDADIQKIMETIQLMSKELEKASQRELELGYKERQLQKTLQLYNQLETSYEVLKKKNEDLEIQNKNLKSKIEELIHQNQQNYHKYQIQTKLSGDLNQKVSNLEQRLDIILECDYPTENAIIRKSLIDLVKECEKQKRELQLKNQEIIKLQEQNKFSQSRINKLNQKLEIMKKKISVRDMENIASERTETISFDDLQQDPTQLLIRYQPCDNLDYRINALKIEFADIIKELEEQGTSLFTQKMMQSSQKQLREQIQLITSQYLSFKDFSGKLNMMLKQLIQLFQIDNLQTQLQFIAQNFKHIFMCQNTRFWILDAQIGILYTNNNQRAIINKGSFNELIRLLKPIHKREYNLLCHTNENITLYTNQCLLYPIYNQNQQLIGILEISNAVSDFFSFDEEYFGVILAKFCELVIQNYIQNSLFQITQKFDSMIQSAFNELLKCKSKFELFKTIRHQMEIILTVQLIAFYFIENNQFLTYKTIDYSWDGTNHNKISSKGSVLNQPILLNQKGIAKLVCDRKKELIVMNTRKCTEFDDTIDIDSILPVLIHPIICEDQVIAVFEVPIKSRNLFRQERDKIMIGNTETLGPDKNRFHIYECYYNYEIKMSIIFFNKLILQIQRMIIELTKEQLAYIKTRLPFDYYLMRKGEQRQDSDGLNPIQEEERNKCIKILDDLKRTDQYKQLTNKEMINTFNKQFTRQFMKNDEQYKKMKNEQLIKMTNIIARFYKDLNSLFIRSKILSTHSESMKLVDELEQKFKILFEPLQKKCQEQMQKHLQQLLNGEIKNKIIIKHKQPQSDQEKKDLYEKLNKLSSSSLRQILKYLNVKNQGEFQFDIEKLDTIQFRKLYQFVKRRTERKALTKQLQKYCKDQNLDQDEYSYQSFLSDSNELLLN
ncbi:unnamed protein product [Paramecium pentaurelia]|uniref:NET domain-containing protein n=1 Tax=Paramecium pentaurelia TaxID=43138 RepID=A0A8S1U297_9CILI|nr:unnamed protein product [Paramecium pentaurelia]